MINKRFTLMLLAAGLILTIPIIAMQFTTEVDWSFSDFIIMGILLIGTVSLIELGLRLAKSNTQKLLIIAGILFLFLLIWAELAVGIFGSPFAGS